MQHAIQGLLGIRHDEIAINRGSMVVNVGSEISFADGDDVRHSVDSDATGERDYLFRIGL